MPFAKYSKWTGVDGESISLEELLDRLADFLLQSGFESSYYDDWNDRQRSLDALRNALMRALMDEDLLSQQEMDQFTNEDGSLDEEALAALVDRLIERLMEEGYITVGDETGDPRPDSLHSARRGTTGKPVERSVKFEMTDKGPRWFTEPSPSLDQPF